MGRTIRHYLFEESGEIKRIPRKVLEGLTFGKDAIPAYAGMRKKVVEVIVENEDGKPQAIEQAIGCYFEFDAEGRIDHSLQQGIADIWAFAFPEVKDDANVVALSPRRKKQLWREVNRWTLSVEDLDRILADIIRRPGTKGLSSVEGIAPRRPALTYDAEAAIRKLRSEHLSWNWNVQQLSEKALAGFIWEARSLAKTEPEDQFLWEAIAAEGERQRDLKRQRRTGKGEWVAVFKIFRHIDTSSMEETFVAHTQCEGEAAAIEAMKRLIVEHHLMAGASMSIEARTMPALEWTLMNGRPF